uniref:IS679 transposase orfB n=5 Tax=Escherichia coli TaxID=562 RepID=A0A2P9EMX4_ECOLX|nr:IS679 transposase orfB [Escherichia coli]
MISLPAGSRIWLVAGITDMRNGFNGLASKIQNVLKDDPFSGHLFIFRGRRGDQIKVLWADSDGLCLFTKRLERGRFVWPVTRDGKVHLTPAQLSMLLEGINWKHPKRTERRWNPHITRCKVRIWTPHLLMRMPACGRCCRRNRTPSARWPNITACSHSGWRLMLPKSTG